MDTATLVRIQDLVDRHEAWRRSCLNLVAAENAASPAVTRFAGTDLSGRYGDFLGRDLTARKYYGTRYIVEIEREVDALARRVFSVDYVEFRPLSGHVAGASVIMGVTEPGDCVLEVGSDGGGHRLAEKLVHAPLAKLDVQFLPIDGDLYNVDGERAAAMIEELRPRLVILGSSNFLFPHPVAALAAACGRVSPKPVLAYDASHVLGLIAGGQFQNPLREGADVMFGSTHKTFPGPQGGLIVTNSSDLIARISEACYPGLITNHHLARLPALGVALLEMAEFGEAYARAIVANARALAGRLAQCGLHVVGAQNGYTQSHTVLVSTEGYGTNKDVADRLEQSNIIVNAVTLPKQHGGQGLRLGVQELTRCGADEPFMRRVADLVTRVVRNEAAPEHVAEQAMAMAASLTGYRFTFA